MISEEAQRLHRNVFEAEQAVDRARAGSHSWVVAMLNWQTAQALESSYWRRIDEARKAAEWATDPWVQAYGGAT